MKCITIDFKPDGQIVVATLGYSGPACLKATAELADVLGPVEQRRLTPEYNQGQAHGQRTVLQTGR